LVKFDPLNVVSHNVAVYGNVSVLNEDLREMARGHFLIRKPHDSMGGFKDNKSRFVMNSGHVRTMNMSYSLLAYFYSQKFTRSSHLVEQ
jgi:hypothetical protein